MAEDGRSDDKKAVADQLLTSMASLRRSLRRAAGRPGLLAGLTSSQVELVGLVRRHPGISVAEAAQRLRLAPNTVSTLVGQLAAAGVLARGGDPSDRRVVRLDLEDRARREVSEWRDRRAERLAETVDALHEEERELLVAAARLLGRLADRVGEEGVDEDPVDGGLGDEGRAGEGLVARGRLNEDRVDEGRVDEGRVDEGRVDRGLVAAEGGEPVER